MSAAASLRKSGGASVSLTILKESAIETEAASPQDRSDNMTEPDVLSRDIDALKALQRDAWRELASPSLTMFDRRRHPPEAGLPVSLEFKDVGAFPRQLAQIGHGSANRVAAAAMDLRMVWCVSRIDRLD